MPRQQDQAPGQLIPGEHAGHSPRVRRTLRHGPRPELFRKPKPRGGAAAPAQAAAGQLAEWHDMTPGEQTAAWAELRAWVTWLYDRYELSVEDRLPRCWALHPGLIEELYALKAWREEIYSSGQPAGQAVRYWHSELRQVLHAATTMYAAGCRTGHRGATVRAATDLALKRQWAQANPLARIPGIDITAGHARNTGGWASTAAMAQALDAGEAVPVPGLPGYVCHEGTWWAAAANGWVQEPAPDLAGTGSPDGTGRKESRD